jgi:hypothetical protein
MLQTLNGRVGRWKWVAMTCSGVWMLAEAEKMQSLTKIAGPLLALFPLRWSWQWVV